MLYFLNSQTHIILSFVDGLVLSWTAYMNAHQKLNQTKRQQHACNPFLTQW